MRTMPFLFTLCTLAAPARAADVDVCFAPGVHCQERIVRELARAKRTIRVQAYSFTSAPIAKALVEAARRGVDVRVVLDKSNRTGRYSAATFLAHAEIPTWIDARHPIAHSKLMIIDEVTVLTGSHNFTKAATRNEENLLVLHSPTIARRYAEHWKHHQEHAEKHVEPTSAAD
jgi:phosphatidylserine/phosphatidylglycerophosphate/cardiolipin synthase-like enzyme